jgi:vancomycin resistance protein YoaR
MNGARTIRRSYLVWGVAAVVFLGAVLVAAYSALYAGKIYPGVTLDGLYVGGLSQSVATQELQTQAKQYAGKQIVVDYGATSLTIPVSQLGPTFSSTGVMAALQYGRHGNVFSQLAQRVRSLLGRPTTYANYQYNDTALEPYLDKIDAAVTQPVANAALTYRNGAVAVTPAQPGQRLERGSLILGLEQQLASMGSAAVRADVYTVAPTITTADLASDPGQAETDASKPITLQVGTTTQTIDQATISSWFDVTTPAGRTDLPLDPLTSFYPNLSVPVINLSLNSDKVGAYVANLASSVDQPAQDAVLSWQNNALVVATPSHTGVGVDQDSAVQQIATAVTHPANSHDLTLPVTTTQPAVNENNLASLGINTLISSGNTTFPGSSAARITNVTVGAARFNDVLLSPGQEFSFGQILGPVGAAQGYLPGLVILGNEETDQYGGGLCQVATTAFRAALLAGLPINERSNHSYAVSFYTAPYGVPGVDATIYYPQVDLKFTNDTGHYILIQTSISGDSLTFNYYGTKTKTGVIIPPHFVYGTTNAAQASETIFQRQVLDLSGNVIKTDTFTQYYQPSTDFPIVQTSNGA